MRIFKTKCIDSVTGYNMILSECSYNNACFWLETELNKKNMYVDIVRKLPHDILDLTELITNRFANADLRFIYDETRGFLMSDK